MAKPIQYDICIIGAMPWGIYVAHQAAKLGYTVAITETTPLNNPDLHPETPYLALKHIAHIAANLFRAREVGIKTSLLSADFTTLQEQIIHKIDTDTQITLSALQDLNITHYNTPAKFSGPKTLSINEITIQANHFLITTPQTPQNEVTRFNEPIPCQSLNDILLNAPEAPNHIGIIGTHPHYLSIAQYFTQLGINVTLIAESSLFPDCHPNIRAHLVERLQQEGIALYQHTTINSVRYGNGKYHFRVLARHEGPEAEDYHLHFSHLLMNQANHPPDFSPLALNKAEITSLKRNTNGQFIQNKRITFLQDHTHAQQFLYQLTKQSAFAPLSTNTLFLDMIPPYIRLGLSSEQAEHQGIKHHCQIGHANPEDTLEPPWHIVLTISPDEHLLGLECVGFGAYELTPLLLQAVQEKAPTHTLLKLGNSPSQLGQAIAKTLSSSIRKKQMRWWQKLFR